MIWSSKPFLALVARSASPLMELFHALMKSMHLIWRRPELFYTFVAPMMHSVYPRSGVLRKPMMAQVEEAFRACTIVYARLRPKVLLLCENLDGVYKNHGRNLIFFFEFLLPTVSVMCL